MQREAAQTQNVPLQKVLLASDVLYVILSQLPFLPEYFSMFLEMLFLNGVLRSQFPTCVVWTTKSLPCNGAVVKDRDLHMTFIHVFL